MKKIVLFMTIVQTPFHCQLFPQNDETHSLDPEMFRFNATHAPFFCPKSSWIAHLSETRLFPTLDIVHSASDRYILSFYWATVTLVCTGYGDVHADLPGEMFIAITVQIIGTIYYSSILGYISAAIQTVDVRRGRFKGKLSDILKFFQVYYVNEETQRQVNNNILSGLLYFMSH